MFEWNYYHLFTHIHFFIWWWEIEDELLLIMLPLESTSKAGTELPLNPKLELEDPLEKPDEELLWFNTKPPIVLNDDSLWEPLKLPELLPKLLFNDDITGVKTPLIVFPPVTIGDTELDICPWEIKDWAAFEFDAPPPNPIADPKFPFDPL